ncbi:hypothetical protein PUR61_07105 [Streptomyces sp. BE20]|uniref:hypothetical protein n=1 Tax=Streptomycetaceae TaxID=2062 RepID=UPI002E762D35|nr:MULTISPECIES: hypothetical protein [unclassified Streptomyces]MED7949069.1 hypothetical protein [Streptomyces sp. BE303]MEE1821961.1 hypothetical protein [Streptomyces sp. BE20]
MVHGGAGPGRRLESAIAWVLRNSDGVVALLGALVVGLLDLFGGGLGDNVVSGATLLVLAAVVYGSLAERRRRVVDIREATEGARQALENLTSVRELAGVDLERALERARQDTDRWVFKGGTGTYLRAVTLPECVQEARRRRRALTVKIDIVHPGDEAACAAYARFRGTFGSRADGAHGAHDGGWSVERTRKESYATVLAAAWYRQRLDTLEIDVHLSEVAPSLRFDVSASCLIITQDDPRRVSIYVERGRPLYDYYVTELHHYREQAVKLDLRDTEPLGDDPTVDEARRLFEHLRIPLPTAFSDRDVGDIIDRALHADNPYRR